ncbi:amylovoran biosynthesis protein [Serratia phage vB_SmaM-Kodama]|nr:amylovoran biosynthesis protein [Serratia phage vB_SmaM-Kodama]
MINGQKISQLPSSSTPKENDYFPFNTVNEQGVLETAVLDLNDLRKQLDYHSAFDSLEKGIAATKVGDIFFTYEDSRHFYVNEYTRNDAGAVATLNEQGKIKRLITNEALQYAKVLRTVESVSDLRTTKPIFDNEVIEVKSYRAGSGIGGGKFTFIKTDKTSTDDGGATIVATDGSRWKRVFDNAGVINPTFWGAAPNDNSIDSGPAFTRMSKWSETVPFTNDTTRSINGNIKMECNPGRYFIKTTITLQTKTIDYDFSGAILDFTLMTPGTAAAPVYGISWVNLRGYTQGTMECRNLRAVGPGMDKYVHFMGMNDTFAYFWAQNSMCFMGGGCDLFSTGFTYNSNTYYVKFFNYQFNHCNICYTNNAAMTNSGEQIHFISCIFSQSNYFINVNKAHTIFDNCSFDYAYKRYVLVDSGSARLIFNDGWFEGEGPYEYAFEVKDGLNANIAFNGVNFIFRASNTKAKSNVFFAGDRCAMSFDKCYFSNLGISNDDSAITGWVSGKGTVTFRDSKLPQNGPPLALTSIQPEVPEENYIRSEIFSDVSHYAHEVWIPSPGGTGCEIRKNRVGWGTASSTNFSIQRLNGYMQVGTNTVPKDGKYQLYIGSMPLKGNGPVIARVNLSSWASSGTISIRVVYMAAEFFGPDDERSPIVYKSVVGGGYDLQLNGPGSSIKTYETPLNIQGYDGQPLSFTTIPDWATHAAFMIDITRAPMNMAHRINSIYMRQI